MLVFWNICYNLFLPKTAQAEKKTECLTAALVLLLIFLANFRWHENVPLACHNKKQQDSNTFQVFQLPQTHLHLDRLAIDEFTRADDVIKDNSGLLAAIQDDVVAFAIDTDSGAFTAECVNRLVHLNVFNHYVRIVPGRKSIDMKQEKYTQRTILTHLKYSTIYFFPSSSSLGGFCTAAAALAGAGEPDFDPGLGPGTGLPLSRREGFLWVCMSAVTFFKPFVTFSPGGEEESKEKHTHYGFKQKWKSWSSTLVS